MKVVFLRILVHWYKNAITGFSQLMNVSRQKKKNNNKKCNIFLKKLDIRNLRWQRQSYFIEFTLLLYLSPNSDFAKWFLKHFVCLTSKKSEMPFNVHLLKLNQRTFDFSWCYVQFSGLSLPVFTLEVVPLLWQPLVGLFVFRLPMQMFIK